MRERYRVVATYSGGEEMKSRPMSVDDANRLFTVLEREQFTASYTPKMQISEDGAWRAMRAEEYPRPSEEQPNDDD